MKIKKAAIGLNLIRHLNLLSRSFLLTVYKCFIRPHLDYGDIVYDQTNLSYLTDTIKLVQYNAITGAIRGTSKGKLYQEIESLKDKSWLRPLCYLYKILSTK